MDGHRWLRRSASLVLALVILLHRPAATARQAAYDRGQATGHPVLGAIRVGAGPQAIAVDERTHRVFVLSLGPLVQRGGRLTQPPGQITVLDEWTGRPLHVTALGGQPLALAVDPRAGHVLVADALGNSVSLLDAATGRLLRTTPVGTGPAAIVVAARTGRAFVLTHDGISVLDTRTGRLLGTTRIYADEQAIYETLAVDEPVGRVFVANAAGQVRGCHLGEDCIGVLDARSGAALPAFAVTQSLSAIVVDGRTRHLLAVGTDGLARLLDDRTGGVLRITAVATHPNVADAEVASVDERAGRAFVVNTPADGSAATVAVLDTRTGRGVGATPLGTYRGILYAAMAIDARRGRALLATQPSGGGACCVPQSSGRVRVLDAASGRLLRTIVVDRGPQALAVAEAEDRAFVANRDAGTVTVLDMRRL